jgi:hypothetical protein
MVSLWTMRVRLATQKSDTPPAVDREGLGVIRGVSIISEGEALGHGFQIDEELVDQIVEAGNASKRGVLSRWTHGNLCEDGLGKHLGRFQNLRKEVVSGRARAIGDLHFSKTAHSFHPEGHELSAPELLMQLAEDEPDVLGISIVADLEMHEPEDDEENTGMSLGRLRKLLRADAVADPAANPEGLFAGSSSELAERASFQLDAVVERFGEERVSSFLNRYWANRGVELGEPAKAKAMAEQHLEQVTALQAQLAERDAQVVELQAALSALREAETERKTRENEAALETLQAQATELGSPIPADDVEHVRDALARGDQKSADALSSAFLSRSEALGRATKAVSLESAKDDEVDYQAQIAARVAHFGLEA